MWEEKQKEEIMQGKEKVETEGIQKKSRLQSPPSVSISDFDKIPIIDYSHSIIRRPGKLFDWLPSMSWILWCRNFTPFLKFKGSKVDIKYALRFDFAALCLWFLYIEVPAPVKDFAAWALATIYNATCKDKDTFVTDQMSVDDLVKTGLHSEDEEVLSQVSSSLALLAYCRRKGDEFAKDVTFGRGVLYSLLELVDKNDSFCAVYALFNIAKVDKGMRDVIVSAEIENSYLSELLKRKNASNVKYVLKTIACLTRPNPRWDDIEGHLIPDICSLMHTVIDPDVWVAAVRVLNRALDYTTPDQIGKLVEMGCLEGLCFHLELEDTKYLNPSFEAIKYILQAGDRENNSGNKCENKYAKYIAENIGWSVFQEVPCFEEGGVYYAYESKRIRVEYAGED